MSNIIVYSTTIMDWNRVAEHQKLNTQKNHNSPSTEREKKESPHSLNTEGGQQAPVRTSPNLSYIFILAVCCTRTLLH